MTSGCCLYLICNQVARLEGVGHSAGAHADTVADTDGTKLVAYDTRLCERGFDLLTETKKMFVASLVILGKWWFTKVKGRTGCLHTWMFFSCNSDESAVVIIPDTSNADHGLFKVFI